MNDDELKALTARAVGGDGSALSALCEQLEGPVFRLCLRMLGDARDAEDAAQDVLVKVVTNLGRFEGRSALMTWVHQIATRHVFGLKKSKAEERSVDEAAFSARLDQGLAFGATTPSPTPEDLTLLAEVRLSCTQGMLLLLSREERLALVLVELLGFDAAEAGEICEVSHAAMRQRLSRARERLSGFLQSTCGVVNPKAACRCERQIAAKKSLGLTPATQTFSVLASGDIAVHGDVSLSAAQQQSVRVISAAFRERGWWNAPPSLRACMTRLLPTLLAG